VKHRPVRVVAAIGALALIGMSVFGLVGSASAASAATPAITSPAGDVGTVNPAITVSGTVDNPISDGLQIVVYDVANGVQQILCEDLIGGTTWSCSDTLVVGTNVITATAASTDDEADPSDPSASVTVTLGTTDPTTMNSVPPSSNPRPVFSGTGPAMGREVLNDGSPLCDANVDADGNWSCSPNFDLPIGPHTAQNVTIWADGSQPPSDSVTTNFTIYPPKPAMSYSFSPSTINVTATAQADSVAAIELYHVTSDGEGGYQFGEPVDGCPPNPPVSGFDFTGANQVESCTFSGLPAGIWNIYSAQYNNDANLQSSPESDFVNIPATPTIAARVNADRSVTLSGTGTAGNVVRVTSASGAATCNGAVAGAGAWACTTTPSAGNHSYVAVEQSQGFVAPTIEGVPPDASYQGISAVTAAVSIVVPDAPVAPTPTYTIDFTTDVTTVTPGDTVTFSGSGPPGATVDGELHSTPIKLGSTTIGPDGKFTLTALIPMDVPAGAHHFVITVTEPGQTPVVVEKPVTVDALPITAGKQTPTNPDHSGLLDTPHRGAAIVNRNDPGAPSALTNSLPTLQTLIRNPIVIGAAAAAGLALLLFVAFPAELLNSTLSENYDRIFGRIPKVRLPWNQRLKAFAAKAPIIGGLVITVIAAIIFGFADPRFGFDLVSVRLVLACAIALFIIGYLANSLTGLIERRRWGVKTEMELKPLGLVLTIVGVVLSRIIGFSPGFLIGLILGLSLTGTTTVKQRSNAVLVRSSIMLGMAVAAWLVMSALGEPDGFVAALVHDTLAGIVTEGLTALVVGLLPFRYLDGAVIFRRSKAVWALSYLVALLAFCLIVLPSDEHWKYLGSTIGVWIAVVIGFAVVTLGLYVFFRARFRSDEETVQEKVDEDNAAVL
jgi:hypothetical protein